MRSPARVTGGDVSTVGRNFRSTQALETAIQRYIGTSNTDPKPFVWTETADDILDSIKRFCQQTSNSHH